MTKPTKMFIMKKAEGSLSFLLGETPTDDNNEGDEEKSDCLAGVVHRSVVLLVGIDRHVEETREEDESN